MDSRASALQDGAKCTLSRLAGACSQELQAQAEHHLAAVLTAANAASSLLRAVGRVFLTVWVTGPWHRLLREALEILKSCLGMVLGNEVELCVTSSLPEVPSTLSSCLGQGCA